MDNDDEKTVDQTVSETNEGSGEVIETQPTAAEPSVTEEAETAKSAEATSVEDTVGDSV